jgi:hypothetical protein
MGSYEAIGVRRETNTRGALLHRPLNTAEQIRKIPYVIEKTIALIINQARKCFKVKGIQFGNVLHIYQVLYNTTSTSTLPVNNFCRILTMVC